MAGGGGGEEEEEEEDGELGSAITPEKTSRRTRYTTNADTKIT
jgi:hypothetical protein